MLPALLTTRIIRTVLGQRILLASIRSGSLGKFYNVRHTMEDVKSKAIAAEQLIAVLKDQVSQLKGFLDQNGSVQEQEEIVKLQKENQQLKKDISQLKFDLEFLEVQNGVIPVPIPTSKVKTSPVKDTTPSVQKDLKKEQPSENERKGNKIDAKEKAKGEKKDGKKKEATGKGEDDSKPVDCSRLSLKIGKIVNVKRHPDADTLYVEEVDLGEERNRTILSGLVKNVPIEEMQGRIAVFMCNLKPAKMRGILSEGMIMCAVSPAKTEIIEPPAGCTPGDVVFFEGYEGEPDRQLNPKRKIWEQVQPELGINSDGLPHYKGGAMTVKGKGICKAPSLRNCMIR